MKWEIKRVGVIVPFSGLARERLGSEGHLQDTKSHRTAISENNFTKVLRIAFFSDIIVGFACQKAWLSAQSEALRVVCNVNDGSKTDF